MEIAPPSNPWIQVIIFILSLLFGGGTPQTVTPPPQVITPAPPEGETFRSYIDVQHVDALLLESFPVQISLNVSGTHDGCQYPVQVEQRREGNTVTVELYREMPLAVMCPAVLITYEDTIRLEGGFESGTYTILVNGFAVEVTV